MIVLGLTGSIAMGKSRAAARFRAFGVPVFDSDAQVHALFAPGGAAVAAVARAFPGSLAEDAIDRTALGRMTLGNPVALRRLEAIVHPLVRAAQLRFLATACRAGAGLVVLDVPLLYETGGEKRVDAVVVVTTSPELQRERVLARGTMDAAKLDSIIARQMPDAEKRKRADFVVDTSHGLDPVRAQIKDILAAVAKMPRRRA